MVDYEYEPEEDDDQGVADKLSRKLEVPEFSGFSTRGKLSWIVVALILLPFVIYLVPQLVLAQEAYVVLSGSMEPAIPTGGVVFVYGTQPENLEKGDIITFQTDGDQVTTHRIIEVVERNGDLSFRTQGDANDDPDPGFIQPDEVVGEVKWWVPYLGYVIEWAGSVNAYLLLVLIPAVLIILDEVWKIGKEMRGLKKRGREDEVFHTYMIAISFLILVVSGAMIAGIIPQVSEVLASFQAGPVAFGVIVMAALLLAMLAVRFL